MTRFFSLSLLLSGLVSGCSSSQTPIDDAGPPRDGGPSLLDAAPFVDATLPQDAADPADAGVPLDAAPQVVGMSIGSARGTPLQAATGDAIPLVVVFTLSDGTTRVAADSQVTWTAPQTIIAQDPYDAGSSPLPVPGASPTAFFVSNAFRPAHPGVLYITDPGTGSNANVSVTAQVADAGLLSATVTILPTPQGDAASGQNLFQHFLICSACHGDIGGGTPVALLPDGGPELLDGGPAYTLWGAPYPFPAPGLNGAPDSGNLAADPAWSFGLFAMSAQSDVDNQGVALRAPMPGWFGGADPNGQPLDAQDFADMYAWLKSQTQ